MEVRRTIRAAHSRSPHARLDLSISVVSYNTREILLGCLRSICSTSKDLTYEIIVVDNGSADGSVEAVRALFPEVLVIANPDNRGYAKAMNQALAVSAGRYFLLLNSDTLIREHAFERMVAYLDTQADIGALGCAQLTAEGQRLRSCFRYPTLREHVTNASLCKPLGVRHDSGRRDEWSDFDRPRDVEWVNGACLMVRTQVLDSIGGLDERFFMYFEDVDLCLRIREQGYRISYFPEAEIVHLVGRSSAGNVGYLNLEWELSRIAFVEKHFLVGRRFLMKTWIMAGAVIQILLLLVQPAAIPQRGMFIRNKWKSIKRVLWQGRCAR